MSPCSELDAGGNERCGGSAEAVKPDRAGESRPGLCGRSVVNDATGRRVGGNSEGDGVAGRLVVRDRAGVAAPDVRREDGSDLEELEDIRGFTKSKNAS